MTALAEATPLEPSLLARLRERFAEPIEAFSAIWGNHSLRRLEYAWVGSIIGTWAYGIALGVYAYHVGGAAAVGLAGLIRTLPTVLFAPFVSSLGDRYPRVRVMVGSDLVRCVLFAIAGIAIIIGAPAMLVYIVGGLLMLAASCFRPAQAALLPSLTETPEQLTAMNVVSSTVESVGFFVGPALGGLMIVATSVQMVFFASALTCLWSAVLLIGMPDSRPEPAAAGGESQGFRGFLSESVEGFRTIGSDRRLLTLVSLFTAQTIVAGALNVFVVVLALQLYDAGPATVGTLNAALGVGGIIGAIAAAGLIGGTRLARGFAFGLVFWGVPLLLVAGIPIQVIGLIGLAVIGVANTVIDVSGFTLLQRAVPEEVLARVFGVLETVLIGGIGLGALLTPVIIHALGTRGALIVVGLFLPLLTFVTWSRVKGLDGVPDAPPERVALLESLSLFKQYPAETVAVLAAKLEPHEAAAGDVVIRQGDDGDLFYAVDKGRFAVDIDGKRVTELAHGDFFGEIALLRDVPRTATITALEEGQLLSLARDDFVPVVRVELLRSMSLFRPLPQMALEFLASRLVCEQLEAGDVVMREGDDGDRFYVIAEGRFDVQKGGVSQVQIGAGDFFGEIALLKDVKRTATVVATTDAVVFSLGRDDFVPVVTGSAPSNAAADEIVGARLGALAQRAPLRV